VSKRQGNEISGLIFDALASSQDRQNRGHLGCSIIGRECEREVWYMWRWAKSPDFPGRILRLFRRGHEEEPNVVKDLRALGAVIYDNDPHTGKQFKIVDLGGHLGGSLDGAISKVPGYGPTWMVLEIKTSGAKPFAKLAKDGVEKTKPEHFVQMQLYMRGTGMRKALYVSVCKDNDELYTEVVDYNQAEADEAIAKARRVLEAESPPAKISEHPGWWKCKFCDHKPHCQGDQAPEANCRTCVHATPRMDEDRPGLWTCAKHDKGLNQAEQLAGCSEHLLIPGLINFAEAVDANPSEGWVEYKSEQGVFFRNSGQEYADISDKHPEEAGTPWQSPDIYALGAKVLTDDPLLESIRRNFGPTRIDK